MKYKKHLEKYEQRGHFLYNPQEDLKIKCNAPEDKGGVYLIYKIEEFQEILIYIGRSGRKDKQGELKVRKDGLYGRIVKGHHPKFGKSDESASVRRNAFPREMIKEGIGNIIVYWWATHDDSKIDCPKEVEDKLLKIYEDKRGRKPDWHKQ